jgi:hypothetical protein
MLRPLQRIVSPKTVKKLNICAEKPVLKTLLRATISASAGRKAKMYWNSEKYYEFLGGHALLLL